MTTAEIIARERANAEKQDRISAIEIALSPKIQALSQQFESRPRLSAAELADWRRKGAELDAQPRPPAHLGMAAFDGRCLFWLGDADETTDLHESADGAPRIKEIEKANAIFAAICEADTGAIVPDERFAKKQAERAELKRQSHEIAERLEKAGIPAYRGEQWSLWTVCVHSEHIELLPQFRRIAFIPYVAASIREPFVRAIEFYLQSRLYSRFWTFTTGQRCRVGELRERLKRLHRKISTLNDQPFMKESGAEIVFRSSELGTPEKGRQSGKLDPESGQIERDESGAVLFHPHAHCLVNLSRRLSKARWKGLLQNVWSFWGYNWDEGGAIRTVREAVKYVTKPAAILGLSPDELRDLYEATRRLKLCHPMGELAAQIKARESADMTLLREPTADGYLWREVPAWNSQGEVSEDVLAYEQAQRNARKAELPGFAHTGAPACRIVARCSPSCGPVNVKEPRVVVMGTVFDLHAVKSHPLFQRLRQATRNEWLAGLALIRVHTGTPTVSGKPEFKFMPDIAERRPPPAEPVFSR